MKKDKDEKFIYKICALQVYYAAYSGNPLPTFRYKLSVAVGAE